MADMFETAFQRYLAAAEKAQNERCAQFYPNLYKIERVRLTATEGQKFIKVIESHVNPDGSPRETGGSAFAFVEKATGAIFKPDGWTRPARHARGSIFNADPLAGTDCGRPLTLRR